MSACRECGAELLAIAGRGRKLEFCGGACRTAHHRRAKRYAALEAACNDNQLDLRGALILELFPGAGLFGKAFEAMGACVVRGPDILWGGDVRDFRGVPGRFDGVIGGPPCQQFSRAAIRGSEAENLIPEFVRIVDECRPKWAVMENVREAAAAAPQTWDSVFLRDWDCGGHTHRRRGFWFYGIPAPLAPPMRPGTPEYSVLASNWNKRGTNRINGHLHLTPDEAARLQGFPALAKKIWDAQPGFQKANGYYIGVGQFARDCLAVHMLGNGVTRAMGGFIARYIALARAAGYERQLSFA